MFFIKLVDHQVQFMISKLIWTIQIDLIYF
jgi:hypothetical protein